MLGKIFLDLNINQWLTSITISTFFSVPISNPNFPF